MRAKEFITENIGDLPTGHSNPMKASTLVRDPGGYDRIYYINRLGMAMAAADGVNDKKIDGVDESSWVEKYNTVHAYTDAEQKMIDAAIKTIPTDSATGVTTSKSTEPNDIHKISPVTGFKGYKRR
jgi:hypothetical protein